MQIVTLTLNIEEFKSIIQGRFTIQSEQRAPFVAIGDDKIFGSRSGGLFRRTEGAMSERVYIFKKGPQPGQVGFTESRKFHKRDQGKFSYFDYL